MTSRGIGLQWGGTWARTGLPTALASATYDAANQIATWGATSFTYDDDGNLTNDGAKTYTWNARNQLAALSGGVSASFQYDGLGRRRAKTLSGASTGFLYDGLNTVQELVSGSPAANILPGLGIDEWLTRTDGAGARHFLTDTLGSTLALADGSGTVQTEYTYEPFGKTIVSGASSSNGLQFTGRENDGTGLFYYRARYFDPAVQRLSSEDPLGFGGGLNLFAYADNAPVSFVDPLGLKPSPAFGSPPGSLGNPQGGPPVGPSPPSWCTMAWCYDPRLDDPANWKYGEMPGGPGNLRTLRHFQRQLAEHGAPSLLRSLRSLEQRLGEHVQKLSEGVAAGRPTSSIQREVQTFQRQIETIKTLLGL